MNSSNNKQTGFHGYKDVQTSQIGQITSQQYTEFTYTFENFFHPFVGELIQQLNKKSLTGMLDPTFHQDLSADFFNNLYTPPASTAVKIDSFPKEIDLRTGGPYANYNWELLFHIPLTIAVHLSKNQRFAEAQRWFHYIFDPTCNDTSVTPPKRFWKFLAFRQDCDVTQIDELLALLSKPDADCTAHDLQLKETILCGYEAIKNNPFQPHAVARTRHVAYQYSVFMKYLDNLINWGDSLFRQDTVESINEAMLRYVLAANLLGPRPQRIPPAGTVRSKTFKQLKEQNLDAMGNALVELEGNFPFNLLPQVQDTNPGAAGPLFGIGRTLYFCIPRNEKILGYWDIVADRLFKIHNSLNLEGVFRQLALFDPPLDPAMLVKAAAAGIDISSIVSGLNQPIAPVRCLYYIQKSLELCAEVRGLGSALLSAIEKRDGESMALLRQGHEIKIQQMTQDVRFLQWKQAQEATESLLRSRSSALERYQYYQRLLGLTPDSGIAPDTFPLDRRELTEENFDEAYGALAGQYEKAVATQSYPQLKLADADSPLNIAGHLSEGKLYMSRNESYALNVLPAIATELRNSSAATDIITSILATLPYAKLHVQPIGCGATVEMALGEIFSNVGRAISRSIDQQITLVDRATSLVSQTASYERRADEWLLQNNLAAHELIQIGRQIISSLISEQVAYHEYLNTQKQIEQSQEVDRFLREKFTSEELYAWMQGEISRLYYEYYRFSFDTARKAEQTMKRELMRPEVDSTDYIKFNYWDGGRKGLLSGETLYLDVKRMEMAYYENNKREYELTKHVSLRQLEPLALLALKVTGACEVILPEWLFDLDCPGHYLRRVKNIGLTIPSVIGPYASINCTLTLLKSSVRKSPLLTDVAYDRTDSQDPRFVDYYGTIQSIVTSSGNNDSGLFETNLRDERFLPFEGAGVLSTWRLELPSDFRQFDYDTISDVILHVRYTAREGGSQLRTKANENTGSLIGTDGMVQLFSLKHDFPNEWYSFISGTDNFKVTIKKSYFPYLVQCKNIQLNEITLCAVDSGQIISTKQGTPAYLTAASTDLNDVNREFKFELQLNALQRVKEREVFLVFTYVVS